MTQNTDKKHLRFPEFENNSGYDWQNDMVLNDVAYLVKGKFSYSDLTVQNYVSTDNMLPDFSGVCIASKIPTKGTLNGFENGDILFSNIRTYLKKVWQAEFKGACNSDVLVFRTKDNEVLSNDFLYMILTHSNFTAYSNATAKGTKMPRGNKQAMLNYNMAVPHKDEQKKIAEFLSAVDKRIALLQAKYDHLQKYKTGILQKIFTQQIRFKQPNGTDYADWEPMLLSEVFDLKLGKVLTPKNVSPEYSENTPYKVFSSQTKNNGVMGYYSEYLFENAITWTTRGENVGYCKYRKGKFYPNNNCGVAIPKEQYGGYANTCIAEMIDKISCKYVSRSSIPILANNIFGTIKIDFPELDEQKRIADFLSALDNKITNTQTQLTKTKSFKQGLLQQMFI